MLRRIRKRYRIQSVRGLAVVNLAAAIVLPFLYMVLGEMSSGRDVAGLAFLAERPLTSVVSYGVFLLIYLAVLFLSRRPAVASGVLGGLCFVMAYANLAAMTFRGEPLKPADIYMVKDAIAISSEVKLPFNGWILLFFVNVVVISAALCCGELPAWETSWGERAARPLAALLCLALTVFYMRVFVFNDLFLKEVGYKTEPTIQDEYEENGLYSTFLSRMDSLFPKAPAAYTPLNLSRIQGEIQRLSAAGEETFCPDIILILDESLSWPYPLEELTFSRDPWDHYKALAEECVTGTLVSPMYGGGTSNVEFEVLTGISTDSDSMTAIPYNNHLYEGFPSITNYLRYVCGYTPLALHPYTTALYNRPEAYSMLGFEDFVSQEDFCDPELAGGYISDASAFQKIIEMYEEAAPRGPVLIHTVTMQNHMPYLHRALNERVTITGGLPLPEGCEEGVSAFATLVDASDEAIAALIDYFRTVDRDVVVVVYGDHQPIIETEQGDSVLALCGEDRFSPDELLVKTHVTPYLVWSNRQRPADTFGTLTPTTLLPTVLSRYGAAQPAYFRWIHRQSVTGTVLARSGELVVMRDGSVIPVYGAAKSGERDDYSVLVYDTIFQKGSGLSGSLY